MHRMSLSKILAGVEGVEPANAGIKIRCLNQLGDTPTQDRCVALTTRQPTYNHILAIHPITTNPSGGEPANYCTCEL